AFAAAHRSCHPGNGSGSVGHGSRAGAVARSAEPHRGTLRRAGCAGRSGRARLWASRLGARRDRSAPARQPRAAQGIGRSSLSPTAPLATERPPRHNAPASIGHPMQLPQKPTSRVFSGMQPTGSLHLGHYLGAMLRWVEMQNSHECIYCVVDMHAITLWQDPDELKQAIRSVTAAYIAAGLDSDKSILFNQSQVYEHAELAWILN